MPVIDIKPITNLEFTDSYIKNENKTDKDVWEGIKNGSPYEDALRSVHDYATNPDKTEKHYYVSGINCDPNNSVTEFMRIQREWGKHGEGVVAHHGWQSFPKGYKISPQDAHDFCVDWLKRELGDRFQIVVTTHLDREHIHSHFIINAVSFADGRKFYGNQETLWKLRNASDEMCLQRGYPIIYNPKHYGRDQGLYRAELRGEKTWRDLVKKDIDLAISRNDSMASVYRDLEEMGYLLRFTTGTGKERKHPSISPPGLLHKDGSRVFIRLRSLGDPRYMPDGIQARVNTNIVNAVIHTVRPRRVYRRRPKKRYKQRLPASIRRYYRFLYQMGMMPRKPRGRSYYSSREFRKMVSDFDKKILYLRKYRLNSAHDVEIRMNDLASERKVLTSKKVSLYAKRKKGVQVEPELSNVRERLKEITKETKILDSIYSVVSVDWATQKNIRDKTSDPLTESKIKRKEI